ncbi:MAG: hypothetical protein HIU84_09125 [Acidobacteria bacterium]|nr:hypothetical protein [Acidobacteriota bacterium]
MRRQSLMLLLVSALTLAFIGATKKVGDIPRALPQSSRTTCVHLSGGLGKVSAGTNGQTFAPIFIRNEGSRGCTLTGVPRLIYNDDASIGVVIRLGLSAARVNTAHRGGTVSLAAIQVF